MTTTTRKRTPRTTDTSPVTVKVVEPHLVYHNGEQRSGTLTDVPTDTAEYWGRHGWITLADDKPTKAKATPKPDE
jgi:hypothetical protein